MVRLLATRARAKGSSACGHAIRCLVTYLVSSQQPLHWWHSVPHWWSLAVAAAEPAEGQWVAIIAHACERTASIGQRSAGWWQLNAAMHGAHTSVRYDS